MFERFTDGSRLVLRLAQEEARRLSHGFIGTEHILLGLVEEGEGIAAQALGSFGITLTEARQKVQETVGMVSGSPVGSPPFTPRAKKVLELSLREALQLGDSFIGTEHLLLGLVREGEGVAAQVLVVLGADLDRVRQKVLELMGRRGAPEEHRAERWTARVGARRRRAGTKPPVSAFEAQAVSESCSLCGRDLWEVAHYLAVGDVRVCENCIRAAAAVLDDAGGGQRALSLPPRVFGDAPDARSVDELVALVEALLGPAAGRRPGREVMEDAGPFETRLRLLDDKLAGASRVSRIRFLGPDRAELRVHFQLIGDDEEITAFCPARRVDGRWVLAGPAVLDVLERAGIREAEPDD